MSFPRLANALLNGTPYFGTALRALQGYPERHRYFLPVVRQCMARRSGPLSVLEIGSWAGASTVSWAKALQQNGGGTVTCVDLWAPYFDPQKEHGAHYREMIEAAKSNSIFHLFLHNIKACGVGDMVAYHVGDSRQLLRQFGSVSFDIVYIDGSHTYEVARSDIAESKRLIRPGGILCGDDLELQRQEVDDAEHAVHLSAGADFAYSTKRSTYYHPGVTEAVAEQLGTASTYDGFWVLQIGESGWSRVELDRTYAILPEHIQTAILSGPQTVGETDAFNIVQIDDRYAAVAKSLGPTEVLVERLGEREVGDVLLLSDNLEDLERRIAECPRFQKPKLLSMGATHNIVQIGERYVAVSQALGVVDLMQERLGERELGNLILIADSRELLEQRIASISRWRAWQ